LLLKKTLITFWSLLFLTGCAAVSTKEDPLELVNRPIYYFNRIIDVSFVRPVSKAYDIVTPQPIKFGVTNIFSNMLQVPTAANELLQGKPSQALSSLGRFSINATLGLAGIFDVATELGYDYQLEDFGQTLAVWGWKESTYFVMPIFGPSTIRDTIGFIGSLYMTVPYYTLNKGELNLYYSIGWVDYRRRFKDLELIVGNAGVDHYSFVRASFLQNRRFNINDGSTIEALGATQNFSGLSSNLLEEPPE